MLTDASKSNTGNLAQFLKEGTRVVVQENVAQTLLGQNAVDSKDPSAIIRFDHDRTIHLGGIEAQALYFGNAYSVGSTVVYFPNLRVVAVGQLYSHDAKLEVMDDGSLVQWSAVLADVLRLDFDVVVPATGLPLAGTSCKRTRPRSTASSRARTRSSSRVLPKINCCGSSIKITPVCASA